MDTAGRLAFEEKEPDGWLTGRRWRTALVVVFALSFFLQQFIAARMPLGDYEVLSLYEAVGHGEQFPPVGRELAKTGFRGGSFEYYLLALPWALGGKYDWARIWLSLLIGFTAPAVMWILGRWVSRRVGLLAGLAMADPGLFAFSINAFQNNSLVPPFAVLFFGLVLHFGFRKEWKLFPSCALGLVVGLMLQIHLAMIFLLPGAVLWLIWRRTHPGLAGGSALAAGFLLPWLPYLYFQATHDWVDLRALWSSGLSDHMPVESSARLYSWLLLFLSPEGLFALAAGLISLAVFARRRRLAMRRESFAVLVFFLAQLVIPLVSYDFFKRSFLGMFLPTVPVLIALAPDLLAAARRSWRRKSVGRTGLRRGTALLVFLIIGVNPVLIWAMLGAGAPIDKPATFRFLGEHAVELGLPAADEPWDGYVHSPYLKLSRELLAFVKRNFAVSGPSEMRRFVLILHEDDYLPDPDDLVLRQGRTLFVAYPPNLTYRRPPDSGVGSDPHSLVYREKGGDYLFLGDLEPQVRTVVVGYSSHSFDRFQQTPILTVEAGDLLPRCVCVEKENKDYGELFFYIFELEPVARGRSCLLRLPRAQGVIHSFQFFARRNNFHCPHEVAIDE